MGQGRPSSGEIIKKVSDAIEALKKEKKAVPNSKHFVSDQDDLGIENTKDLWPLLVALLEEVKTIGPLDCYAGSSPPQKSYEIKVEGKELWAYSWESQSMNKKMYIKFCLIKGHYFYMGCHESKVKGEEK